MTATLIIGGGGYIGSHMVYRLLLEGYQVVILDDFSTGFEDSIKGGHVLRGDLGSDEIVENIFDNFDIDSVIHFASAIEVGESIINPKKYYLNNVTKTLNMLDILVKKDVKYLVFSSSAAVYGNVCTCPISEEASLCPASPYGRTKHIIEQALADYRSAYGLHSISLRYFNAAGADTNACLGERHDPETHLIPLVLQVASGRRDAIRIFGRGYDTEDGTCIRDYVHVTDLCDAHLLALKALRNGQPVRPAYNLGNGEGHSVSEVIRTAGEVTGRSIKTIDAPMRPGDPAMLVADTSMARRDLGWRPRRCSLAAIIEDAWRWELAKGMFW